MTRHRVPPLAATAVMVALVVAIGIRPVAAHSSLVASCPMPGDVVHELEEIELTFSSRLIETDDAPARIFLAGDAGRTDIALEPVEFVSDTVIRAAIPVPLEPGVYIIRYRVLSEDGDDNDGGFEFSVDPEAANPDTCGESEGGSTNAGWILLLVGVVALVGVGLLLRPRASE